MITKRLLGLALAGLLVVIAGGVWSALLQTPLVQAHTLPSGTTAGHGHFNDLTIDSGPVDFDHLTSCLRLPTDGDGTLACGTDYTWTDLAGYPAACTNGKFVEAVGDTLDCSEDETISDNWTFTPVATGANGAFDLTIGGSYGGLKIGNVGIYSSSFSSGANLDLDKSVLFRQQGNLGVGNDPGIEFVWQEQGNTIRMAIPESGSGNATAFIRSGTFAGPDPSPKTNDIVTCNYWSAYDSNIDCDTGATGADLFVQDDLEVEGTIYGHETINLEGATADGNHVIIQVGADPGADVTLTLPTSTSTLASVPGSDTQVCYNDNGALGAEGAFTYDDSTDSLYIGPVGPSGTAVNTAAEIRIAEDKKPAGNPQYLNFKFNDAGLINQYEIISDANSAYPGPALGAKGVTYLTFDPATGASGSAVFKKTFNATAGGAFEGDITFSGGKHQVSSGPLAFTYNTMTSTDATPDVSLFTALRTAGTTTITDFDGVNAGHWLIVYANSSITVQDGAGTINLLHDVDFDMVAGDILILYAPDGSDWYEVSRSRWDLRASATWDPISLVDGVGETKSFTVTGAEFGDFVTFGAPYDLEDMLCSCYVQAADTVECRLQNETGGVRDLASGTWYVRVHK